MFQPRGRLILMRGAEGGRGGRTGGGAPPAERAGRYVWDMHQRRDSHMTEAAIGLESKAG